MHQFDFGMSFQGGSKCISNVIREMIITKRNTTLIQIKYVIASRSYLIARLTWYNKKQWAIHLRSLRLWWLFKMWSSGSDDYSTVNNVYHNITKGTLFFWSRPARASAIIASKQNFLCDNCADAVKFHGEKSVVCRRTISTRYWMVNIFSCNLFVHVLDKRKEGRISRGWSIPQND